MRKSLLMAVLAMVLFGQACATKGKEFSSDVTWIKKDITKKSEVTSALGDPYQVGYASGQPTWTYGFYEFKLFGDSFTKELKFYWNRNGTVSNFSFTSSFPADVAAGTTQQQSPSSQEPGAPVAQ